MRRPQRLGKKRYPVSDLQTQRCRGRPRRRPPFPQCEQMRARSKDFSMPIALASGPARWYAMLGLLVAAEGRDSRSRRDMGRRRRVSQGWRPLPTGRGEGERQPRRLVGCLACGCRTFRSARQPRRQRAARGSVSDPFLACRSLCAQRRQGPRRRRTRTGKGNRPLPEEYQRILRRWMLVR